MVGGEQGVRAAVVALPRGAGEGFGEPIPSAEVDVAVIRRWHLMATLMLLCRRLECCPASWCLQTAGGLVVGIGDSLTHQQGFLPGGPWGQDRMVAVRSSCSSDLVVFTVWGCLCMTRPWDLIAVA